MNLFQTGNFVLASGKTSTRKIECDALTPADWATLAAMAVDFLPPFRTTFGVPRGGFPFANALQPYATQGANDLPVLIVEDVVSTGGSIERHLAKLKEDKYIAPTTAVVGVCLFAQHSCPGWITPLFRLPPPRT